MVKNWLQPWKYMTIKMANETVLPVIHLSEVDKDGYVSDTHSEMYRPVYLAQEQGAGEVTGTTLVNVTTEVSTPPLGILYEVFAAPQVGAKVLVEGIAPLRCTDAIKAGSWVIWTGQGLKEYSKTQFTKGAIPLGIALRSGDVAVGTPTKNVFDVIPVLIKTAPISVLKDLFGGDV